MKLYDLLSSADTKPMDKITRNIPQWMDNFLIVPLEKNELFYKVNMNTKTMCQYCPSMLDMLATDWEKC